MKLQKILLIMSLMLIQTLVIGCGQQPTVKLVALPSATSTLPTSIIAPAFTPTPIPGPTRTPTAVPTFPVELARAKLLDLLANNGNCHLPCLWGIIPGKSTTQEARAILEPFGGIAEPMMTGFDSKGGAIFPDYSEGDLTLHTIIGFNSDNQIVSRIGFQAREFKKGEPDNASALKTIFDYPAFGERLRFYMLPNILTEHGIPTAVLISTDGGPERGPNVPGFYILLFYPNQGMLINYTTSRQIIGGKVRGCPANAHVELELYPAGHGDSFSQYLSQTQWANLWPIPADSPAWKPIEKAASMTLEQFYETFQQPTDKCIETPVGLWTVP